MLMVNLLAGAAPVPESEATAGGGASGGTGTVFDVAGAVPGAALLNTGGGETFEGGGSCCEGGGAVGGGGATDGVGAAGGGVGTETAAETFPVRPAGVAVAAGGGAAGGD